MPDPPEVKSVPLRRRLFLLAAAGMVPIALMSGIALRAVFEQQREEAARAGLSSSRITRTCARPCSACSSSRATPCVPRTMEARGWRLRSARHPTSRGFGLPVMDGYEVARRIRAAEGGGRATLLVAVTGYGSAEDRERSFKAGFDAHLVKPVDSQALDEVLASMAFREAAE